MSEGEGKLLMRSHSNPSVFYEQIKRGSDTLCACPHFWFTNSCRHIPSETEPSCKHYWEEREVSDSMRSGTCSSCGIRMRVTRQDKTNGDTIYNLEVEDTK